MRCSFFFVPLLFFLFIGLAFAEDDGGPDFHFKGSFAQGGLVTGQAPPGSLIHIAGKSIHLSKEGYFVIAFGREAKQQVLMNYRFPDGKDGLRRLLIEQREFPVEKIDGLSASKVTPSQADIARIQIENKALTKARQANTDEPFFMSGFSWPVMGRISGVYGSQRILNGEPRSPHFGTDIAAPKGTIIKAPADGIVAWRHPNMFFNGKTLLLDHGHGLFTIYAHLDYTDVEKLSLIHI